MIKRRTAMHSKQREFSFEDKITEFLRQSEEKIEELKKKFRFPDKIAKKKKRR